MPVRRALRELKGFVFDLDGCVWTGNVLVPGAADVLAFLRRQGRGVCFLTNNSRARAGTLAGKLARLGVEASPADVLTPLEILGEVVSSAWGRSRVLAIGGPELSEAVAAGGHDLVPVERYREATVVVVGNDFDLSYERLTAAARAVAGGAAFVTPNLDPRLPLEDGEFLPGCGAIVEAVAAAAGARPFVVGKPEPPLFERALLHMGLAPEDAAMVGDSVDSDIRGARRIGMSSVLFAPQGGPDGVAHYVVRTMGQLRRLLGDRPARSAAAGGGDDDAGD
ncbi:MAG TPA: HAD-IIA family hydrolase [Candidatus Binatia bacterium]|nr:HAD-IIA family hydrolase [Candidatus Binatia bacterium]